MLMLLTIQWTECLNLNDMEPLKKSFYTLKSLIEDVNIEIVYETFEAIDDEYGSRYNAYQEIYRSGGIPVEKRYAIRIDKVLLVFYRENLKKAFIDFRSEIERNLETRLLRDKIPKYIKDLEEILTKWSDCIVVQEIDIELKKTWYLFNNTISTDFLNSKGISNSIINGISSLFLIQRDEIIKLLDYINSVDIRDNSNADLVSQEVANKPEKVIMRDAPIVSKLSVDPEKTFTGAIPKIYKRLEDEGFISKDSNKKSFNQLIFGPKVEEPIIWAAKVGTLHYFFKQLENKGIIKDAGKGKWILIWNSFLSEETGQQFNKSSVSNYSNKDVDPRKRKIIDEILDKFVRKSKSSK